MELLGITLVDEAKGDDEEDEASPDLVAGVQLAYSKRKPERKVVNKFKWALSQQPMRPKAEWTIDSEALRARGIIVFVKSNQLVKNIETKQLKAWTKVLGHF